MVMSSQKLEETRAQLDKVIEATKEAEEQKREFDEQFGKSPLHVMSDYETAMHLSKTQNINLTEARKQLDNFPQEYSVNGESISDLVKQLRKARRKLKGSQRERMLKSIDTIIEGYSEHIQKCINSIYWLEQYKTPLMKMNFNEKILQKLNKIETKEDRRGVVDALCKYWEAELKQNGMAYSKEYAVLEKEMRIAKKQFKDAVNVITDQSLVKSKQEKLKIFILKSVCENSGISIRELYDTLPNSLHKSASPKIITNTIKKMDIMINDDRCYKKPELLVKNIWAYTAAFIDSDGYITMDRNFNPRVGLIATGDRGKAFMEEMHKSIGFGKLHLNQKSPQDTRPVNRLNFYSQDDVMNLLTKCLPHLRLKKGNAELLIELIRMKKSYKKEDWYAERCEQIFKLMKWENHKDHVGFDWLKEGIYLDDIQKYKDNCKISLMDSMEQIGGMVLKEDDDVVKAKIKTFRQAYWLEENKPDMFRILTGRYGLPNHPNFHYNDYKEYRKKGYGDEETMNILTNR